MGNPIPEGNIGNRITETPISFVNDSYIPYILVILLSVLCILIASSKSGIGYGTDAVHYLGGADAIIADGMNATHFGITIFPPLLSFTLALLGKNLTLILIMNVILLILCLALMAWMMAIVGVDTQFAVGVVWMVGVSAALIFLYAEIRSEALYLVLVQLVLISLAKDKLYWATFFAAIAPLQRYAGVVLVAVGVIYIFYKYGWQKAALFGGITVSPIVLWRIRNSFYTHGGQEIAFHPISLIKIFDGLTLLGTWFLPVCLMIGFMFYFNRRITGYPPSLIVLLSIFIVIHILFYLFSISFVDAYVSLNSRHLAPILITGWVVVMWAFNEQFNIFRRRSKRLILAVYYIFIIANIVIGYGIAFFLSQQGLGLGKVIKPIHYQVMDSIPAEVKIYSNHPILIQLLGSTATNMPLAYHAGTLDENLNYESEMNVLFEQVQAGETVILWFDGFDNPQLISKAELEARLEFEVYEEMNVFSNVPLLLTESDL